MADRYGQHDNGVSGGSDKWDNGLAGSILLQDYFEADSSNHYTVTVSGVTSQETVPGQTFAFATDVSLFSTPSSETFGTVSASFQSAVSPPSIGSAEATPPPSVIWATVVQLGGVPSSEAVPGPVVAGGNVVSPVGIPSGEVFGTGVSVEDAFTVSPTPIVAGAMGTPSASFSISVSPVGVSSASAFGTLSAQPGYSVSVGGVPSSDTFGAPTAAPGYAVSFAGVASGQAFGTLTATPFGVETVSPTSIAEGAMGNPVVSSDAVKATRKPGGGRVQVSYDNERRPEAFTLRAVSLDGIASEEQITNPGFSFVPEIKYPVQVSVPVVVPEPVLETASVEGVETRETVASPVFGFTWVAEADSAGDCSAVGEVSRTRSLTLDEVRKIKARNAAIIAALVAA